MNDKNSKVDSSLNLDQDFEDVDLEDVNDIFNWISSDDPLASIIEQSKLETLTDLGIKGGIQSPKFSSPKPIEYKRIHQSRFPGYSWSHTSSIMLNSSNRIDTTKGLKVIDFKKKNTTVLNIGTGLGKTTLVYNMIKQVLDKDHSSIVILCSPFLALIEKDYKKLTDKSNRFFVDPNEVVNFKTIKKKIEEQPPSYGFSDPLKEFVDDNTIGKRLHIMTTNCFLGNPGSLAFTQKFAKRAYVSGLLEYCKNENKKVYLVFDEIHASIGSFRTEFIYALLRWKSVIKKCVVSTATITESVFPILKHLAYLTDDSLHVVEIDRNKAPVQANLDIYMCRSDDVNSELNVIPAWLEGRDYFKNNKKKFHIISWSKNQTNQIRKSKMLLNGWVGPNDINVVIGSQNESWKKPFDSARCNIGTAFNTGVDIENPEDALIIILPSNSSPSYGTFSNGVPSILQSIARLRNGGNILIVIPPVYNIIDDVNTMDFNAFYLDELGRTPVLEKKNISLDFAYEFEVLEKQFIKQHRLVSKNQLAYNKDVAKIEKAGGVSINERPEISFKDFESYILEVGQEYLVYSVLNLVRKLLLL